MNRTSSYNLCQWEETDRVRRTDFNEDNVKIDQALGALRDGKAEAAALSALSVAMAGKGNCRVAAGSYTGSGTFGENSPNTLTFPFKPRYSGPDSGDGGVPLHHGPGTHLESDLDREQRVLVHQTGELGQRELGFAQRLLPDECGKYGLPLRGVREERLKQGETPGQKPGGFALDLTSVT